AGSWVSEYTNPPTPRRAVGAGVDSAVAFSVGPGPADVGANVETGPVVHDRSRRRWRLPRQVRCLRGTSQHHSGERRHSKQEELSHRWPPRGCADSNYRLWLYSMTRRDNGPLPTSNTERYSINNPQSTWDNHGII